MSEHREELAVQHELARRDYPDADQHEVTRVIMTRLSEQTVIGLAADVLG